MTRQSKISAKDLENISAYLDNALSTTEKADFEVRLAKSLPLQKKLKEYTQLKVALKKLSYQPAPRDFTLTTEEARGIKRKPLFYPAFSYIALTAALLLALVFTSEFIFNNFSAPQPQDTQATLMLATEAPVEENVAATEAPQIFTWGYGYGVGGKTEGMGGGGSTLMSTDQSGWGIGGGAATAGKDIGQEEALDGEEVSPNEESAIEDEKPEPTIITPRSVVSVEPIIFGLRADEAGEVISVFPTEIPKEPDTQIPTEVETSREMITFSNYLKYGLTGVAVLFGALAFVYYRKQ